MSQKSTRRSTRSQKNETHPGLVDAKAKRRTRQEVVEDNAAKAAAKAANEAEKKRKFEAAVKRIADEEARIDEHEAADVTPRPAIKSSQRRGLTYSQVVRAHPAPSHSDDEETMTEPPSPDRPTESQSLKRSYASVNVGEDSTRTVEAPLADTDMELTDKDNEDGDRTIMIYDDSPSGSEFPVPPTEGTEATDEPLEVSEEDEPPKKKAKAHGEKAKGGEKTKGDVKKPKGKAKPKGEVKKPGNIGMRDAVAAANTVQELPAAKSTGRPEPRRVSKNTEHSETSAGKEKSKPKAKVPERSLSEQIDEALADMETEPEEDKERKRKRATAETKNSASGRSNRALDSKVDQATRSVTNSGSKSDGRRQNDKAEKRPEV